MIPAFGGFSGGRISDWGFWTVVVVAILAGATIVMGMRLAFEEDSIAQLPDHKSNVIVQTV